jgi:hypothetical protein
MRLTWVHKHAHNEMSKGETRIPEFLVDNIIQLLRHLFSQVVRPRAGPGISGARCKAKNRAPIYKQ